MAVLSSKSSIDQIEAEYADCAGYYEDTDASKARRFVTAITLLLLKRPTEAGSRESHLRFSPDELRLQQQLARDWIAANAPAGPQVTQVSFENFRRY